MTTILYARVSTTDQTIGHQQTQAEQAKAAIAKQAEDLSARLEEARQQLEAVQAEKQQAAQQAKDAVSALKAARDAKATAEQGLKERDARIAELQASLEKKRTQETAKVENSVE